METVKATICDEALLTAAQWWVKAVCNPTFDCGAEGLEGALLSMMARMNTRDVQADQATRFQDNLFKAFQSAFQRTDWLCFGVDYGPDPILREAAVAAGVQGANFPWKTDMSISPKGGGLVQVSKGYGAPNQIIFGDPIYTLQGRYPGAFDNRVKNRHKEWHASDLDCDQESSENMVALLQKCAKHRGWTLPELEKVSSADASAGYELFATHAVRINAAVAIAQETPSVESYFAAAVAHNNFANQVAAWRTAL